MGAAIRRSGRKNGLRGPGSTPNYGAGSCFFDDLEAT
jgi:hypothetical protein